MAVSTNFQVIGLKTNEQAKLNKAVIAGVGPYSGSWRVQFIGGRGSDVWEMRVSGKGTELSEFLDRTLGQHEPVYVEELIKRLVAEALTPPPVD